MISAFFSLNKSDTLLFEEKKEQRHQLQRLQQAQKALESQIAYSVGRLQTAKAVRTATVAKILTEVKKAVQEINDLYEIRLRQYTSTTDTSTAGTSTMVLDCVHHCGSASPAGVHCTSVHMHSGGSQHGLQPAAYVDVPWISTRMLLSPTERRAVYVLQ